MEKKVSKINPYNDDEMVAMNLRNPRLAPRDISVWRKTPVEKETLSSLRRIHKHSLDGTTWPGPYKSIPNEGKLIIYITKNENYSFMKGKQKIYKTTFSHKCLQHRIPEILTDYSDRNLNVTKYSWNGRTYSTNILPNWYR